MRLIVVLLICWLTVGSVWTTNAQTSDILTGLRSEHPRLIITTDGWNDLRARLAKESNQKTVLTSIIKDARKVLTTPPLVYKKEGKRLLAVSREAVRRIILCAFSYRVTGDKVFLERAQKDMLTAAAFGDWNPSHFLDVGEMTAAVALGYDWLFDALAADTRATLRQAILEKGIKPGLAVKKGWPTTENNWNQVCYGGLSLGALAIADESPEVARQILTLAQKNNPIGLKPYAPSGIYPEGPGYWNYGTSYQVLLISALQTALGTDWNLSAAPGFLTSAEALVEQIGPTGRPFNFSDCGDSVPFEPTLFWFAQKLKQPSLIYFQNQLLQQNLATSQKEGKESKGGRLLPFLAIWINNLPKNITPPTLPLAWHGDGPNPVGVFRSSWTDSNALFVAFKGGSGSVSHGHMDAGSFVLDAGGVRWASDLGAQNYYSVESKGWALFDKKQDGDRWTVYRLNNFSHNTLTLGGKLHNVAGDARITEFTDKSATVNLSQVFAGQASSVIRRFRVDDNRTTVIRDDITGAKPGLSVRWQMLTHTKISVDKNQATLQQDGKILSAKILSPAGAKFEIASAQPPQDGVNQPNPNTHILVVNTAAPASGDLTVEIQLQPQATTTGQ